VEEGVPVEETAQPEVVICVEFGGRLGEVLHVVFFFVFLKIK
jgi:hypothetical protein